ncbi:MAG: Crp/Fnr family transcriptional regulator [Methylobacterium sp.]|nr:Crp/Fnr family transcriptional regulator [Methylobacterium sp.]
MAFASGADIVPMIRKLESIAQLSPDERQALDSLPITRKRIDAHEDIVREGDRPSQCCLLLQGWAFRYKLLDDGKRQILSLYVPGDIPDLQSLHLRVMDHNLAALTPSTVAFIPHDALRDLTARFPGLTMALWRDTLIDSSIAREWMTNIGRRSTHGRIAHLFCEIYLKLHAVGLASEYRCEMAPTQNEIADAIGVSNVHVNRVLQDLRANGLIAYHGNDLVIRDWGALVRLAQYDPAYLHLDD